jgi:6-phosphogluconolactonase
MLRSFGSVTFLALLMVGCAGGDSGSPPPPPAPPPPPPKGTYTISGTVSGLQGSGLTIQIYDTGNWGQKGHSVGSPVQITSNGPFTIEVSPPANSNILDAEILQQPVSPFQYCLIHNGFNISAIVKNIEVGCSQFTYVANAGDNTVSAYTVDATSGALIAVGTPVKTGMSPHAIVETPDRAFVFVGNERSNDITAYAVNVSSGVLTPMPGSPFPAGTDPIALAYYGGLLYVANAGSDTVSAYAIDSTGALTPSGTFATGKGPSSMLLLGPQILYVANHGGSNDISAFYSDLTPVPGSPFPAGGNPLSLAAAAGGFLYSANPDATNPSISGFSVDPANGALSPLRGSPFPIPVSHYIATVGAYLYVTSGANVIGYSIDANTGDLTALAGFPVTVGVDAYSITIDSAGRFLYVTDDGAAHVSGFAIDAATGALTPLVGSPFPAGNHPEFIAAF